MQAYIEKNCWGYPILKHQCKIQPSHKPASIQYSPAITSYDDTTNITDVYPNIKVWIQIYTEHQLFHLWCTKFYRHWFFRVYHLLYCNIHYTTYHTSQTKKKIILLLNYVLYYNSLECLPTIVLRLCAVTYYQIISKMYTLVF